ncbi:MAG: hypothetical protein GXY83_43605 [Rhodopirellula sp.]|nr:hypothetical protein [Rhodopirellula sp.]
MPSSKINLTGGWTIAVAVVLAVAVAAVAVSRVDLSGDTGSGLPQRFDYSLETFKTVDPSLILYRQAGELPLEMSAARAVAVGPEDRIYVVGDQKVVVYNADGTKHAEIILEESPRCLAVGGAEHDPPGRILVGMRDHVEVYAPDGKRQAVWERLGEKAVLTSIAVADAAGEPDVFVADAGNRIVLRYDSSGKRLAEIGRLDREQRIRGFIIPSPYFDVAVTPDGLLRAVNPGMHRIEAYTFDGHFEEPLAWGKAALAVEGFCGCCNPANMAVLPGGGYVTGEKGIPRVKVYGADGAFVGVVAGPDLLAPTMTITEETREDHELAVVDVAADSRGRVLVLDPAARKVRIFERRDAVQEGVGSLFLYRPETASDVPSRGEADTEKDSRPPRPQPAHTTETKS